MTIPPFANACPRLADLPEITFSSLLARRTTGTTVLCAVALPLALSGCQTESDNTGPGGVDPGIGDPQASNEEEDDDDASEDDGSDEGDGSEDEESEDEGSEDDESEDDESEDDESEDDGDLPKFDIGDPEEGDPEEPCDLDFLFVIDNSGSMADEQTNLAASVPEFVTTVRDTLDIGTYHLAVTTTDAYTFNGAGCQTLGSFVVSTGGLESSDAVCGPYAEGANFMTDEDDLDVTFPCAARPGIDGNTDEKGMESLGNAIGPALTGPGACNEGFLQSDALLVIVLITDEEDDHEPEILPGFPGNEGSAGEPDEWFQSVMDVKELPENVVVLGLIGIPKPKECVDDPSGINGAEVSQRIPEFVENFGVNGFLGDVCAPSYGSFFEEAVSVIDTACDNIPK